MKQAITLLCALALWSASTLAQPFAEIARITTNDPSQLTDNFGQMVAIAGDYAIATASYRSVDTVLGAGQAFLYHKYQGGVNNWGLVKTLMPEDTMMYAEFGYNVAMDGDYAVISAPYHAQDSGTYYGAISIFHRNEGGTDNWGLVKTLYAKDVNLNNTLGEILELAGDYLIVGAPYESFGSSYSVGTVLVYHKDEGGPNNWGLVKRILPSDTTQLQLNFGGSIAMQGDRIVISSMGYSPSTQYNDAFRGAVTVHYKDAGGPNNWGQVAQMTAADGERYDLLGQDVAIDGDVIYASLSRNSEGKGKVYLFEKDQGGVDNWGATSIITGDEIGFGRQIVIDGNSMAIGDDEALRPSDSLQTGAIYFYERNLGGANNWGLRQVIVSDSASENRIFPLIIGMDNGYLISGMQLQSLDGAGRGMAAIFQNTDSIMTTTHSVLASPIGVYPNPVLDQGLVTIEQAAGTRAILYNVLGQPVREVEILTPVFQWNIGDLPSGQYVLRFVGEVGDVHSQWLLKQ